MKAPEPRHVKATYAALYAMGSAIPKEGISSIRLATDLAKHLDSETLQGLLLELERRRIVRIMLDQAYPPFIFREQEYIDGLERLRLAAEQIRLQ